MNKYVIINYPGKPSALARLHLCNRKNIFALASLHKHDGCDLYWTKERTLRTYFDWGSSYISRLLYVNSDLQICGQDARLLYHTKDITLTLLNDEIINSLLENKENLKKSEYVLNFFNVNILDILDDLESLASSSKLSESYLQFLELFKDSDSPILCKVSNTLEDLTDSTTFKLIKKEFKILQNSFITVENESFNYVKPLAYRLDT